MEKTVFSADYKRIDRAEALELLTKANVVELGERADAARRVRHGNSAYYAVNAAITYSNICEALCPICSFSRKEGQAGAYLLTPEDVRKRAEAFSKKGAEEIHIIGGMYSKLPLENYLDVVRAVKSADSKLNVVSFTVSECVLMSRVSGKSLEEVIGLLTDAGTGALPGGGAEIFDQEIRSRICPDKGSTDEWLEVHETAHRLGIPTNATILFPYTTLFRSTFCACANFRTKRADSRRLFRSRSGAAKARFRRRLRACTTSKSAHLRVWCSTIFRISAFRFRISETEWRRYF